MKKIFEDIWFEISCKWNKVTTLYYDFKYGIKNLIRWFHVIWNDRDWDFVFMFALLEKKFQLMEESFERGGKFVVGCDKQIKRFKICKEICRRLKDDWWYHENTFMFHDKKWGDIDFILKDGYNFSITRKNIKSKEDDEHETKESLRLHKIENARKDADMEILQMYIKKYWKTWWW